MTATPRACASSGVLGRSEEHTSELQSQFHLVCRLLLEKKKSISMKSCLGITNYTKVSWSPKTSNFKVQCSNEERKTLHFALLTFFFFNETATTEIYTLSLHDALPISVQIERARCGPRSCRISYRWSAIRCKDRKSTRLNSSHSSISYAVFCLKKK